MGGLTLWGIKNFFGARGGGMKSRRTLWLDATRKKYLVIKNPYEIEVPGSEPRKKNYKEATHTATENNKNLSPKINCKRIRKRDAPYVIYVLPHPDTNHCAYWRNVTSIKKLFGQQKQQLSM